MNVFFILWAIYNRKNFVHITIIIRAVFMSVFTFYQYITHDSIVNFISSVYIYHAVVIIFIQYQIKGISLLMGL